MFFSIECWIPSALAGAIYGEVIPFSTLAYIAMLHGYCECITSAVGKSVSAVKVCVVREGDVTL